MTAAKKVLCVCARGLRRSKYLSKYLRAKGYSTRCGGLEAGAEGEPESKYITQDDVNWADVIIIVRKRLKTIFDSKFKSRRGQKFIVLDVTDSRRLLPNKYEYLKDVPQKQFDREWVRPQLRKSVKPYLPL